MQAAVNPATPCDFLMVCSDAIDQSHWCLPRDPGLQAVKSLASYKRYRALKDGPASHCRILDAKLFRWRRVEVPNLGSANCGPTHSTYNSLHVWGGMSIGVRYRQACSRCPVRLGRGLVGKVLRVGPRPSSRCQLYSRLPCKDVGGGLGHHERSWPQHAFMLDLLGTPRSISAGCPGQLQPSIENLTRTTLLFPSSFS